MFSFQGRVKLSGGGGHTWWRLRPLVCFSKLSQVGYEAPPTGLEVLRRCLFWRTNCLINKMLFKWCFVAAGVDVGRFPSNSSVQQCFGWEKGIPRPDVTLAHSHCYWYKLLKTLQRHRQQEEMPLMGVMQVSHSTRKCCGREHDLLKSTTRRQQRAAGACARVLTVDDL